MKCLSLILSIVLFTACHKSGNDAEKILSTFQYKYNDTLRIFTEGTLVPQDGSHVYSMMYKQLVSQREPINYYFEGYGGYDTLAIIPIYTDSLMLTTYSTSYSPTQYEDQAKFTTGTSGYGVAKPGDTFTVTITSYGNGLVSGTFSGSLSLISNTGTGTPPDRTEITEGKFTNVPMYYYR